MSRLREGGVGVNVAIYARKSTEQSGVSEEEKSVTRQIEHAKAYALKKGWSVHDELIFVDDGISGAEFVKRPGFIRLMNALKPRPAFQFLVMSEESRLGREQIETAYALKQIMDAGVRVFFYLEDRERTLDSALDKMMLSLTGFASEVEREKAKQRTYDAMLRKAKAGHVTGGVVYGYENKEILSADGRRHHVVRVIKPDEAVVIRHIYEMSRDGHGITRIARRLNEEGIPAPRKGVSGWAPTAVREMLYRPLYRGEIVWNELEKFVRGGTKQRRRRDEKDWIRVSAPELQIIPDTLSMAVDERLARRKNCGGRGLRDIESPYLLSGLARCKECGGPMESLGRDYSRRKGRFYGCAYHRKRGTAICKNSLRVEQAHLDKILLQAINDVLNEKLLEVAVEKALQQLRSGQDECLDRRMRIKRELSLIEAHEVNLVDAIARGETMDPLLAALKVEQARKKSLILELDTLFHQKPMVELDVARLKRELRTKVTDTKSLLERQPAQARQILKALFEKPLTCEVFQSENQRGYRVSGEGSLFKLLPTTAASLCVVSPTGFEPVLLP